MPDHVHLLLLGWSHRCRQQQLVRFIRRHTKKALECSGACWQKQPYDNILREKDRARDAFESVAFYVINNPVRAGIIEDWHEWPYSAGLVPGYPELNLTDETYWDHFWRIYNAGLPDDYMPPTRRNPT